MITHMGIKYSLSTKMPDFELQEIWKETQETLGPTFNVELLPTVAAIESAIELGYLVDPLTYKGVNRKNIQLSKEGFKQIITDCIDAKFENVNSDLSAMLAEDVYNELLTHATSVD